MTQLTITPIFIPVSQDICLCRFFKLDLDLLLTAHCLALSILEVPKKGHLRDKLCYGKFPMGFHKVTRETDEISLQRFRFQQDFNGALQDFSPVVESL